MNTLRVSNHALARADERLGRNGTTAEWLLAQMSDRARQAVEQFGSVVVHVPAIARGAELRFRDWTLTTVVVRDREEVEAWFRQQREGRRDY